MRTEWKKNDRKHAKGGDIAPMGYVMPQNEDLEAAVLAAILLERNCFDLVAPLIRKPEVFYREHHRTIFTAIMGLHAAGKAVDLLTVTDQLNQMHQLEMVGGAYALSKMTMAVVSTAHVENHARILVEKWMAREMITVCQESVGVLIREDDDVFEHSDTLVSKLMDINTSIAGSELKASNTVVYSTLKHITDARGMDVDMTGVPSGFDEIDAKTGGWQKQNLIILAARPAVGKTSFALNLAMNAAMEGYVVAVFSLEMSSKELYMRLLSAVSTVEVWKIQRPSNLTDQDMILLNDAAAKLSRCQIFTDDTAGLNPIQLRAKARKVKNKHGLDFIVVDYLQLMETAAQVNNREQEVSKISRDLKKTAKDLDVPILALSQLNRAVEKTPGKGPQLSDLRESGAIEQDADVVMFLTPPSPGLVENNPAAADLVDVNFAKGRSIGTGTAVLRFNRETQKWSDVPKSVPEPTPPAGMMPWEQSASNRMMNDIGMKNLNTNNLPF